MRISNVEFLIKQSYNDPTVIRFGIDYKELFSPNFNQNKDDFFSIEGKLIVIFTDELKFSSIRNVLSRPKISISLINPLRGKP